MKFIEKSFDGKVPQVAVNEGIKAQVVELYEKVGQKMEAGSSKVALDTIFEFVRAANRYFDEEKPWITVREDLAACEKTMTTCTMLIQNFAVLLKPFLPFASEAIEGMLQVRGDAWEPQETLAQTIVSVVPLYERIDVKQIDEELEKLAANEK
ncbi:class I tRNA ligase family protein [Solibacillus sp. MA9]|uniref:Class I tRNA ligase family protein n=1 Tax=Solibacillus palustris TaxID=2908203 RepID=A0ABS9UBV7_9BACL|nr:class I tRNA ligase family protein [Solibacillus sp. MA9]MCH7321460.1 class I tRNA ligase family protein [Solibacillus sp. MA9]